MTSVRTVPAHEVVRRTYPRPEPEEKERFAIAVGRAIDQTLSQCGYELHLGRKPTATRLASFASDRLHEALEELAVDVPTEETVRTLETIARVVQAYRRGPLAGLPRPRSRLVLLNERFGYYAQPDYWDGKARFFEMKSYRAIPPPPDVLLQLRLFQMAFPQLEANLVCIDRHSEPVQTTQTTLSPPSAAETEMTLRLAYQVAEAHGQEKVLEYIDLPRLHYRVEVERRPEETGA